MTRFVLLTRPRLNTRNDPQKLQVIACRVPPSLVDALDEEAMKDYRSRSYTIRRLLSDALGVPFVQYADEQAPVTMNPARSPTHEG